MSQTSPATRTALAYPEGDLSALQLFDLIDQYNDLVEDTQDFATLMDADAGITATDYVAGLTAAQIDHSGYTTTVASPAPVKGLFGTFPVGFVTEELARAVTAQLKALGVDVAALAAGLDADGAITAAVFGRAHSLSNRLVTRATTANAVTAQDSIRTFCRIHDPVHGHHGMILAAGVPDTGVAPRILRSADNGRSWHALSSLAATVTAIVSIVQVGEKLFLFGNTAAAEVVYESEDFGRSWTAVTTGVTLASNAFTDALVIPGTRVILASGAAGGEVLRSPDGGVTWAEIVVTGPTGINSLGYSPSTGKVMACGDDAILYSSTDEGAVFAEEEDFSGGNPDDCRAFLELANGYWLVTTHDGDGTDELLVSQDSGATWEAAVAVTGAQDELDRMAQGPNGYVYIAVGADVQVSDDNGASVEVAGVGVIFPANDTVVACFGKDIHGNLLAGTTNATDSAGIWLVGSKAPVIDDAYDVAGAAGSQLLEQDGGGVSGRWLSWARETYSRILEQAQALGAMMDDDGEIGTATYEAAIATKFLTVPTRDPIWPSHNVGHGASA